MAEGPQVRLRTEWLRRHLEGKRVFSAVSPRPALAKMAATLVDRQVDRVFCKGKNIFLDFGDGRVLHNHLLMRGSWRKLPGQSFLLPEGTWLALYVGPWTVCNLGGQRLDLVTPAEVEGKLRSLGPDLMDEPFPRTAVMEALAACPLPVGEAVLEQSLICGVGNTAKSEALFLAGIDPRVPAWMIPEPELAVLADRLGDVLRESYRSGGRWECRVYRRAGTPCPRCRATIRRIVQGAQRRATYFCPRCQSS